MTAQDARRYAEIFLALSGCKPCAAREAHAQIVVRDLLAAKSQPSIQEKAG